MLTQKTSGPSVLQTGRVLFLPLGAIRPNPAQPRSVFDAAGLQELAGNATLLYYMTEEGREGKNAFLEKRRPNYSKFTRLP